MIITGSSAPNLIDPVTGKERRATSEDIARIARLVNELPGYDVFSISTLAEDAPPGYYSLARLMPTLKNCLKPLRISSLDEEDAGRTLRLGALVAGSEAAYRDHPFITHHTCPVVSPLTFDVDSTEMLLYYVERGYPYYGSIVPNAGLTSPMSLPATLAQGNAEFLAYAALTEMVKPGSPLIYSTLPTVADMRTGAYAPGGIECAMLHMGFAQMARFYNVPCGGYIGLTNSKVNDAQAGYETGMSVVAGLLGGVGMFNMSGLLDSLLAFDFAKAVIDDEIAMMLRRLERGFEFAPRGNGAGRDCRSGPGWHLHVPRAHRGAHAQRELRSDARGPRPARKVGRERRRSIPRRAPCSGCVRSSPASTSAVSRRTSRRASAPNSKTWSAAIACRRRSGRSSRTRRCTLDRRPVASPVATKKVPPACLCSACPCCCFPPACTWSRTWRSGAPTTAPRSCGGSWPGARCSICRSCFWCAGRCCRTPGYGSP